MVFHENDTKGLVEYLKKLEEYKVDAIIASDMFIIDLLKENNINLEFHLSTQSSCLNKKSAELFIQRIYKSTNFRYYHIDMSIS